MTKKIKAISLFEKWQASHKHFVNEKDVLQEFFILLLSAREQYVINAIRHGQRYSCFVKSFVNQHKHMACDKAICKNVHEENHALVHKLLIERTDLALAILQSPSLTGEDCHHIRNMIYFGDAPPKEKKGVKKKFESKNPISFDCRFTEEQLECIADCANNNKMFRASSVSKEDMAAFFNCKPGFSLVSENIRKIAVMLDALQTMGMISWDWKRVIECGQLLTSKKSDKLVTATTLSTALSAVKKHPTSYSYCIVTDIEKLLQAQTTDKKA